MTKQGNKGSITQQKKRYNDDFMLQFNGSTSNRFIQIDRNYNEISYTNDWSISLFVMFYGSGDYAILDCRDSDGNTSSIKGFEIGYLGNQFYFVTGAVSPNQIDYTTPTIYQPNRLYHCVYTFNSVDKKVEHYINSQKVYEFTLRSDFTMTGVNRGVVGLYSYIPNNAIPLNGLLRDIATFNKKLSQQEINYIYQTGILPTSSHINCQSHLPLNNTPIYDANNIMRSKGSLGMVNFNKSVANGDEIVTTVIDITYSGSYGNNGVGIGFRTSTGGNLNNYYAMYIKNGFYQIEGNSIGTVTGVVPQVNDIIKAKINGNFVEFYVNNVIMPTQLNYSTLSNISNLKAYILAFNSYNKALQNTKYNNVLLKHTDVLEEYNATFGDRLQYDVVENYNYAKTVPITATHGAMLGWTDNQLGLNTGTSTFTAYADFYTKTLGQNFTGGGDSVTYKGKELRKYGLSFNGINQYLEHPNFNATKESGYTIIVFYANKTNSIWGSTQSIFSKYGSNGNSRQFDLRTNNLDKRVDLLVPISPSGTLELSSYQNGIDNSKIQMASYVISTIQDVPMPYEKLGSSKYYGYQTYNTVNDYVNQLNTIAGVGFGFDEITAGITRIGQRNGSNFFDGNLACLMVFKGIADQEFIKRRFNNGLINLPSDYELDSNGLEFVLCPDFNNPFDDAGTLKIPDLITVEDWTAFNYTDLTTLQNARFEIKSLM